MSKNIAIINGNWTVEGNFSGYNAKGERIHIYGAQMTSLGYKKDDKVKTPLYVIATTKSFSKVDDKGVEIPNSQFERVTATAVFASQAELAQAHVADAVLDVAVKQAVKTSAKDAGLTEAEVASLLEVF